VKKERVLGAFFSSFFLKKVIFDRYYLPYFLDIKKKMFLITLLSPHIIHIKICNN